MVKNIFLDESGYTGDDLVNPIQQYFAIASLVLQEEQARDLKHQFFGKIRARELKHASLSKHPKQQLLVLEFLNYLKTDRSLFAVSIAHKRFALVTKMVDLLVEPMMHEDGLDLHHQGGNIALSNLLFYALPSLGGEAFYRDLLTNFQAMMRSRSPEAYQRFFELVFQPQVNKSFEQILTFLRAILVRRGYEFLGDIPPHALDLSFTLALVLMNVWRSRTEEPIILTLDASTNMQRQMPVWDAIVSGDLRPASTGYDQRRLNFPIGISESRFQSSNDSDGIQLADVLAGALTYAGNRLSEGDARNGYSKALIEVFSDFPMFTILPSEKFTPEELGTIGDDGEDPIEYVAGVVKNIPAAS